jgi:initiation factor 1A
MPPNAKGGKGYKKGKHGGDTEPVMIECNNTDNQMYGRVMRSLGNRRFRIFCNDNKERICKICGAMRKSQWVEEGLIVIISIRDLSNAKNNENSSTIEIGDIIELLDTRLYGKMKKIEGINPLLFADLENRDANERKRNVRAQESGAGDDEDLFDRGEGSSDDSSDGEEAATEGLTPEEARLAKALVAKDKRKTRETDIQEKRNTKYTAATHDDADVNVDDL